MIEFVPIHIIPIRSYKDIMPYLDKCKKKLQLAILGTQFLNPGYDPVQ